MMYKKEWGNGFMTSYVELKNGWIIKSIESECCNSLNNPLGKYILSPEEWERQRGEFTPC